ncbi:MAG: GTPase [Lachnospiraceae bacterium]|nr:GTPase [Lachnospiraceae bacterium]
MEPIRPFDQSRDLNEALEACKDYVNHGQAIAGDAISLLKRTVKVIAKELNEQIANLEHSNFKDNATVNSLASQLSAIRSNFEILPRKLTEDIAAISKGGFSITLFGRTMAGKSTLMEILIRGKGESIGKGAQRTTRDVRTYTYRGLQITDVPGIAAFEGNEDEETAFEAAKKCDLILFLITADAPQASEAECLSRILGLGKPVICLVNVKANINGADDLAMFRRDIRKAFDSGRLERIRKQFLDFGLQYGQDWRAIRFAYVHLKAAFLSQQARSEEVGSELYRLSRFRYVENLIVNEVCKNGGFYKMKAYSDTVVVPVIDALESLFRQSAQNSGQGSVLVGKRKKLKEWIDIFRSDGKDRIEALLSSVSGDLKSEIASFAEDNYDNPDASREWNRVLKSRKVEERTAALLDQLGRECKAELEEITREIRVEIKFSNAVFADQSIDMHAFVDGRRIWNWATNLVSGGLMVAGLLLASGPIGWIGVGIGVLGNLLGLLFFDDRENQIRDARRQLEEKLAGHIDEMLRTLRKRMTRALEEDLLKKQALPMLHTMDEIVVSLFRLSEIQWEFASRLNEKLREINGRVIREALIYSGYDGLEWHVRQTARIPGYAMMLVLEDGERFPEDASRALRFLLKENVWFIFEKDHVKSMLAQAIGRGCDRNTIRIQSVHGVSRIAHIPSLDSVDAGTKNRIRLAQQITELLIMK